MGFSKLEQTVAILWLFGASGLQAWGNSVTEAQRKYEYRSNGAIEGHCTVLSSVENPLPAACDNLTLILKSASGEELERAQTNAQGNFKFKAQNGLKYMLSCASNSCEMVSPQRPVRGGDLLEIQVNTKP